MNEEKTLLQKWIEEVARPIWETAIKETPQLVAEMHLTFADFCEAIEMELELP